MPTADHAGLGRGEASQGGSGFLRTVFLKKTDDRVQDHDRQDSDAVAPFAEADRDGSRADQYPDDQAFELPGQNGQC